MIHRRLIKSLETVPLVPILDLPLDPLILGIHRLERTIRALPPFRQEDVHSLERITLGGVDQWILIRGRDSTNPLLVFLHGGPGMPLMPFRHANAELERAFTVVHWDQRGAGKSYSPGLLPELMRTDQLVADACQLLEILRMRFPGIPVVLAGYSCGSVLGMRVVSRRPDLVDAYVGICQVARMAESEEISYRFALENALRQKHQAALRELEDIGPPPYRRHLDMLTERKWVNRFGGFFHAPAMNNMMFYKLMLASPDYTVTDIAKMYKGVEFSSRLLWREFYETDLFAEIPRVERPVIFMTGKFDYLVPAQVTERYCETLESSAGKRLIRFEHSAHWPFLEEPERFHAEMRRILEA